MDQNRQWLCTRRRGLGRGLISDNASAGQFRRVADGVPRFILANTLCPLSSSWFLLQRHPGGTAKAVYGEATYSQVPRDGRRPSVHDLPCEASRSAKMGEGRSDRNLYAHGGAARRRNQGGDRGSAPTLGSKCRDLPGRPGEARAVGPGGQGGGTGRGRQKTKEKRCYIFRRWRLLSVQRDERVERASIHCVSPRALSLHLC